MAEFIDTHQDIIDLLCYFMILPVMALWESLSPRRDLTRSLRMRWFSNISLFITSVAAIRWFSPVLCAGFAAVMAQHGIGLFAHVELPVWLVFLLTVLALDVTRYGMHVLYHRVPLFWRLHRLHHTDQDFDFTTSVRFHPFELALGMSANFLVIAALGLPPQAVLLAEALSFLVNTLNHGNVRIPGALERLLRLVIVTPDMHRVHHSADSREFNANLGGFLSWWDRLFGTYIAQPEAGHGKMRIGLPGFMDAKHLTLGWMLAIPFLPLARPEAQSEETPARQSDPAGG